MRPTILALAVALATSVAALQAQAAPILIFDSLNPSSTTEVNKPGSFDLGGGNIIVGTGIGSLVNIPVRPTPFILSHIEVKNRLTSPGSTGIRFVVFEHATHTLVGQTDIITFTGAEGAATWKSSGAISHPILGTPVVLTAGQYDIGAIANQSANWSTDTDGVNHAAFDSGITSTVSNPNFENISNPTVESHGGLDGAVRLYAVPEPSSLALSGVGLIGMAGSAIRRRRTKKAVATPAT